MVATSIYQLSFWEIRKIIEKDAINNILSERKKILQLRVRTEYQTKENVCTKAREMSKLSKLVSSSNSCKHLRLWYFEVDVKISSLNSCVLSVSLEEIKH